MEGCSVNSAGDSEALYCLVEEEEHLESELAQLLKSMETLGEALIRERHARRLLDTNKQWLLSRKQS